VTARSALRRLRRSELPIDTVELARFLIGTVLVHDGPDGRVSGRIVETEAYPLGDPASHAYRGRTRRNGAMFLERGLAYVYLIYGTSVCMNVTSEEYGTGAGILVRALEPLDGIADMERRRGTNSLRDLARGPGRLTQALGIALSDDGVDLCAPGPLWLARRAGPDSDVGASVRIGLTRAAADVLRFYERSNPFVSGVRRLSP
jgi:DNA-3-methyladenine glycosylase